MTVESILGALIIGGLAGWIAGLLVKGSGQGILLNIVVGIVGAVLGNWLFGLLDIHAGGLIGSFVIAVVGAGLLLGVLQLIRR